LIRGDRNGRQFSPFNQPTSSSICRSDDAAHSVVFHPLYSVFSIPYLAMPPKSRRPMTAGPNDELPGFSNWPTLRPDPVGVSDQLAGGDLAGYQLMGAGAGYPCHGAVSGSVYRCGLPAAAGR
jgi:hypothetical protein